MAEKTDYIQHAGLSIEKTLYNFVNKEVLPGTEYSADHVWQALADLASEMTPRNRALLQKRLSFQEQIDQWHQNKRFEVTAYRDFLLEIGYLVEEGEDFTIDTRNVDPEIARTAAPQLVVPVNNARYALNAANARWGSLYDAVYGSDMLRDQHPPSAQPGYDPERGAVVVRYAQGFLDRYLNLKNAQHMQVGHYFVEEGQLKAELQDGTQVTLREPEQFIGYRGTPSQPRCLLFRHHNLHVEIHIDRENQVGQASPAGVSDVCLESAVTVIQDCEDSVAAVDGEDKTGVYRNWLGLMKGDLSTRMQKGEQNFTRTLAADRHYLAADGSEMTLKGRALMLVRNVGHLMTTPAVLDSNGDELFEGLLDALITSLIAVHDLKGNGLYRNSESGSVYIVKPKMHGPEEVTFAVDIFSRVENALGLPRNTLKLGLMDEEKRTTLNLKECIRAARERLIFINTGFLDRTGDEIHTAMLAGPMVRKADMKREPWILAYENTNVDIGLACGLSGKAQIGKGMWPMPDEMAAMVEQKANHPEAGANCAWVPSPTAATLHAMHYHETDVWGIQDMLGHRSRPAIEELLTLPLANPSDLSEQAIQEELDNNCQGILGYVVRWIDQGIGCSKVPDINNIGLMEDRATLRISSQHIANWLFHGLVGEQQVIETLRRMASVVDAQNAGDPNYIDMAPSCQGLAFETARQLIFRGREVPTGYTEPVLHAMRLKLKQQAVSDQEHPVRSFA